MAGPEELLVRMVEEVFNEPDADRRAAVIAEVFSADVVFTDPSATVTGRHDLAATRMIGDAWLSDLRTLALEVPSAVLPHSSNLLLNPLHPRAGELRVISQQPFEFDPRLRPPP